MNHQHHAAKRGFSSVIVRHAGGPAQRPAAPPPRPQRPAQPPTQAQRPSPKPAPVAAKPKAPTADVVPYGIELTVLPRGDGVRLRLSLERYSHGPRLVATEWAKSAEGFWYPRRSRSLALALDEEAAFGVAFAEARIRLPDLPPEVQK